MKRPLPTILYSLLLVIAIAFFGFTRLLPVAASRSPGAPASTLLDAVAMNAAAPLPTATATPPATPTLQPAIPFPTEVSGGTLFAFIEAPQGALNLPYVNLTAFQTGSFSTTVTISGTVNAVSFICPGSPCTIQLQLGESRFVFQPETASGLKGDTVYATVEADLRADGYHVTIASVSQFSRAFQDSCLKEWNIEENTGPSWAAFPAYPYQLNTQIPLHLLAARLITYGLVDARDCPAGGLSSDMNWPNGCGLQRASDKMIAWENQYDDAIWTAANQVGIPPKILKTLIEVESQFWPGNERFYVDEYGLGQVNQLGVDVLLRNDYNLYQQVCPSVLTNCTAPYVSLEPQQQALVRGALLASQNSACASCQFGLDLTRAKQSITFIAQLLKANCDQVKLAIDASNTTADYETLWRLTLLSYHGGITCMQGAISGARPFANPEDWATVANHVTCSGGRKYVDNFWANLSLFDSYQYIGTSPIIQYQPVYQPTQTPLPSPTPVISDATAVVTVYIDRNGNGTPEPNEGLDGIPVQLIFPDGKILSAVTKAGIATFNLQGYITGTQITATLPNLYRSYRFYLPQTGTVPIIFSFAQPTLPAQIP